LIDLSTKLYAVLKEPLLRVFQDVPALGNSDSA
jgi:hypothetical protein